MSAPPAKRNDITGLILAGGQSRRMGREKALAPLGDRPLLEHVFNALARVFDSVLIAGPPELGRPGLPTVPDEAPGRGPIAGLASGLRAAQTPWIFAVPCDSPFIPEAFLLGMAGLIGEEEAVVPRSGGFYEPLHALYSARCLPVLEELIESGERKILKLYERIRVRTAPEELIRGWDPAGLCFLNINTPEDLAQAEKYLAALGLKSKI